MDELLYHSVAATAQVNMLQLVFLVLEGCLSCSLGATYIVYLLRLVSLQRYTLYETFLAIPLGLTRALATQSTSLLDDDTDSEEDDDTLFRVRCLRNLLCLLDVEA